ncbi:right-handed parallel beta-helix repeat-containing protein [Kribbella sp. NPDC050281]|uniref:carboxypeptidase regulatory-like domain-containing protein n=1 Tax=Kribbella sp. NPDC050281 TaxID=3155515 RepID=UPI0033D26B25
MTKVRRWVTHLVVPAVGVTMVVAGAAPASAALPAESPKSAPSFAGYTDKTALKTEGRSVVDNGALPVVDGSAPPRRGGTTYYVDSAGGDDTAKGKSPSTAWKTLAKVNATAFGPGDRILLKAGSSWSAEGDQVAKEAYDYTQWTAGQPTDVAGTDPTALLAPKGSGSAARPIILSSYGDGAAPELNGRGVVNDVVQLNNQEHWDISNVEISNVTDGFDPSKFQPGKNQGLLPGEENPLTGDLRGIHVQAENSGTLAGYSIHNVFVHDVSGVMWSIGSTGLDRSKRTGGILFEGLKGDAQTVSQFEDITVKDNYVANTAFANVIFKQFSGMGENRYKDVEPGWGDRAVGKAANDGTVTADPDWRPHQDIEVSGNYLTNRDTQYGWDSLYLTSVQRATVEGNVIDGAGVSGIEMYYTDNVVVQNNEVAELETRVNAADSNGIDPDRGSTNILVQGNYIHDSGEGVLLCGFGFGSAVVRYNIIQDVDRNYVNPHGDSGVNVVYNNLMYNTQRPVKNNTVGFFESSGTASSILTAKNAHYVLNNVFVNTRADVTAAQFRAAYPGVRFSNNAYYGPQVSAPDADPNAITADPRLGGNPETDVANAAPVSSSSPLISAGTTVDLSAIAPGFDATGNALTTQLPLRVDFSAADVTTPPTVGPASYRPADGNGLLTGMVMAQDGHAVPGATVTFGPGTTITDARGRYVIEVSAGKYTLTPSAEGFEDGQGVKLRVRDGAMLRADLTLGGAADSGH